MKLIARAMSMSVLTLFLTASMSAQAVDAIVPDNTGQPQLTKSIGEMERGSVGPAAFVVVTYDLTKHDVVKAEVRQDSVPDLEEVIQQSTTRAVFLLPDGGAPVIQIAIQRQSNDTEIELLTHAPTFDAEAVIFQGISPGVVLVRGEAFWPEATRDGPRPRVANACEGTTVTYRTDGDIILASTTCVQLSQTLVGEVTFPDGSGRKLRSYNYCYMCWNCWTAFGAQFCDAAYTTCGGCVGQYGYIPRG